MNLKNQVKGNYKSYITINKIFSFSSLIATSLIFTIFVLIILFLILQTMPVIISDPKLIKGENGFLDYILPLVFGTTVSSFIALLIATPFSLGCSIFISYYTSPIINKILKNLIDIFASIPSVIYGIWGITYLTQFLRPIYKKLEQQYGWWIPIFRGPASTTGRTLLTAGIILSIILMPIIISLSNEILSKTPCLYKEGALALGLTYWEMIKTIILPFNLSNILSIIMLALGRALGETMAVAMILSSGPLTVSIIQPGNQTIAAEIALNFPEASYLRMNTLFASGLILFLITLIVNVLAKYFMKKEKKYNKNHSF